MRLIIVRHGETQLNREERLQPHDTPLNEQGREQARQVAKRLKNETFNIAYVSDMDRAMETARIILGHHDDVEVVYSPDLREIDTGVLKGKHKNEMIKERKAQGASFAEFKPVDGESMVEGQQRICKFYYEKIQDHAGETVLFVSHGAVLVTLLVHLLGKNIEVPTVIEHMPKNTAVTILELDDQKNHDIVTMNCVSHLRSVLPAPMIADLHEGDDHEPAHRH